MRLVRTGSVKAMLLIRLQDEGTRMIRAISALFTLHLSSFILPFNRLINHGSPQGDIGVVRMGRLLDGLILVHLLRWLRNPCLHSLLHIPNLPAEPTEKTFSGI